MPRRVRSPYALPNQRARIAARFKAARARLGSARKARVAASRGIKVSSGVGRNGFSRTVPSGYRSKTRFQRSVQRVIFNTTEKKYRMATIQGDASTDLFYNPTPWYHNGGTAGNLPVIHLWNMATGSGTDGTRLMPTQGMTDGNRIGDEIYATGISVKLMLNLPSDRRTTGIKVWFCPHNTTQGTPSSKAQFFHIGAMNNVMLDQVQTDRWPGLKYLGLFRDNNPDNITANAHAQIYINLWIPLKRKITFITDGDTVTARGLKEVGTLVFAPYDKIGTLETDIVVNNMQGRATFHYKDP